VVKISETRDTLGPIARSVADCALLDAIACDLPPDERSFTPAAPRLRIGVPRAGFWSPVERSMQRAATSVLSRLEQTGIELVECDIGFDIAECAHAGMLIAVGELLPALENYFSTHRLSFDAQAFAQKIASADVRAIFQSLLGPGAPPAEAVRSAVQVDRPRYQRAYAECFSRHRIDALIFPTTPLPAARIGEDDTVLLDGESVATFATFARNTAPGSVCGLPGLGIPMGVNDDGLPLGIALDGPIGSDRRLLAIGACIEGLLPPMPRPARR
jgi:mandelamide amidase